MIQQTRKKPPIKTVHDSRIGLDRASKTLVNAQTASEVIRRFTNESPALRARRLAAIRLARLAAEHMLGALNYGYIWPFERITDRGRISQVFGAPGRQRSVAEEGREERSMRLRQLIVELRALAMQLESAPIPSGWLASEAEDTTGSYTAIGVNPVWQDVAMFFLHYEVNRLSLEWVSSNLFYITRPPARRRLLAPLRFPRAIPTGINIIVPDPENAPLVYSRLTGYERGLLSARSRGVILEVYHDQFGYFYTYRSVRHDLPRQP